MSTLREESGKKSFKESSTPTVIYVAVGTGAALALLLKWYDSELSINILSEIIGAAFTLFVIDVLLVKSKTKRWLVVQEHIDYLIGRTINRIRDGVATRTFAFRPVLEQRLKEAEVINEIRVQRERFLNDLSLRSPDKLASRIELGFFTEENYDYFYEKAEDIWRLTNMSHSEFMEPSLVALMIELHTNLVDVTGHIRFYMKGERFPTEKEYYQTAALNGVGHSMKEILRVVIRLKEEGYSDAAKFSK